MMAHIIRIGPAWLRRPLLTAVFPFSFVGICLGALAEEPRRLGAFDFYDMAWACFWAAWDGYFVP